MPLSVPANYDVSILKDLKSCGTYEIYGKLPADVVGGGRPSYMSTPLLKGRLKQYIQAVHREGMEFNYLLNSACYGNREWTGKFHRELDKLLEWLTDLKVETLTVSLPYLAQVILKRYPHFKIKAGIYAQIDSVKRAQFWEDLGASALNLESFSINRDLETLAAIRKAVKADLVLIANHFCQPNCGHQIHHQNGHAHASARDSRFLIDYPLIQCQKTRLQNPRLFISSGWIRPEDLGRYEELGYRSFKLLERNIPSEALVLRARAYHQRRFEGNLADLLFSWGFKKPAPGFSWSHLVRWFKPWKMPWGLSQASLDFLTLQGMLLPTQRQPITIDSRKIPANFLDRFTRGSCRDRSCEDCGYCAKIARDAVHIDEDFLKTITPVYKKMEDGVMNWKF